MNWSTRFVPAIPLPEGGELVTLGDAGRYIMQLPEAAQHSPLWHAALEVLLLVAAARDGPAMFARVGMMQALYPRRDKTFAPRGRKGRKWAKVTLLRDQR